ncbi:hypothetical protein [Actinokineospora globicatena]|uniref:hypothetical protein n=1 Tax=Actinokineospora globicatena TaxID=103729 RepID=UPI0020A3E6BE|nr:hypothetical protein [Actinokineospora globicatena]MCP2306062.1 hypothetical protein [Actinokineospora globicatena]GLW80065.1 hypothetical protein Aglo01_45460 [Actinokineospora globicatena]GLW86894.1 hypothetical protein Aglo02_45330 [Actinokineospora globicatena]
MAHRYTGEHRALLAELREGVNLDVAADLRKYHLLNVSVFTARAKAHGTHGSFSHLAKAHSRLGHFDFDTADYEAAFDNLDYAEDLYRRCRKTDRLSWYGDWKSRTAEARTEQARPASFLRRPLTAIADAAHGVDHVRATRQAAARLAHATWVWSLVRWDAELVAEAFGRSRLCWAVPTRTRGSGRSLRTRCCG